MEQHKQANTNSLLKELNQRYQEKQEEFIKEQKQKRSKKWIAGVSIAAILTGVSLFLVFNTKGDAQADHRTVPKGLPETEVENWKNKAVDEEQFFITLNTALTIQEGKKEANLSILNPPYSAYDFQVDIILEDQEETLLYRSELIKPGTYLQMVEFREKLKAGIYEAMVYYTFYGETQEIIIGEHCVPVTIEVNN